MKSPLVKCILFSILLILISEITKIALDIDKLLYNTIAEKLTTQQLNHFFELQNKWKWISYVFFPIYIVIKTSIIATVLYVGTYFFIQKEVGYNSLWNIVIKAEFIFLLVATTKIIWFYFFQTNYDLEDIQYFYPLSALNIVGYRGLETWFIYPFQTLNLFELAYWLILAYFIGKETDTNMDKGLKIVAYSYVPALLLWVTTVMFFTLNYS
ncbi:hypothetical protein [Flavobacterium sp. 140616W15]|uniref:hypothetical protein n=1 Tax=Flavobacterium sp. 140616W15 TaxID=2478552 RepID=UPI000F0CF18A|nr:hypothetical protein [Flavobacterium sp. 140616W15]AYN06177.1 hypothetical protein EAG11_19955 [Flavobacterium sp. 140616W15]